MTFQTLAVFLISWIVPTKDSLDSPVDLPRWERHPMEQRFLREKERTEAWSKIPRSW